MIEFTKPRRAVYAVFVHCSASDSPAHDDIAVMRQWHLARGWADVGYHFFVKQDGEIQVGRALEKSPAAQRGDNTGTIAICLHGLTEERFTEDQFNSLRDLCAAIDSEYRGGLRYRGHNEVAAKACPVFDYKTVLGLDVNGYRRHKGGSPVVAAEGEKIFAPSTLRIFDRGESVRELQRLLNRVGAYLVVDGIFGHATKQAVLAHQMANRLDVDGIVGQQTWRSLAHSRMAA